MGAGVSVDGEQGEVPKFDEAWAQGKAKEAGVEWDAKLPWDDARTYKEEFKTSASQLPSAARPTFGAPRLLTPSPSTCRPARCPQPKRRGRFPRRLSRPCWRASKRSANRSTPS